MSLCSLSLFVMSSVDKKELDGKQHFGMQECWPCYLLLFAAKRALRKVIGPDCKLASCYSCCADSPATQAITETFPTVW